MIPDYSRGLAFILEGDTEKIFYLNMIKYFCTLHFGSHFEKLIDEDTGEVNYVVLYNERKVLIKLNVVSAVSQITNAGSWFENRCKQEFKSLNWTVFLCYDTDNYLSTVTKFYEGDWLLLRKQLKKGRKVTIIDLAASADIEDIMLLDTDGIFNYLDMEPVAIPTGSKGKRRMKRLFRLKGPGVAYHEGDRAKTLIESLNMDIIIRNSSIPFSDIEVAIFS